MRNLSIICLKFVVLLCLASSAVAQSTRSGVGAIPYADTLGTGTTFRVWAPNASSVEVAGDFNAWQYGTHLLDETNEYWSLDIEGAVHGDEYKYVINGSLWRKDPRSRRVTDDNNSVVVDAGRFDWSGDSFTAPAKEDLVIYELHVGSFYDPYPTDSYPATFNDVAEKLDYLSDLGINCIELMPVSRFPGDRSWGYNPIDLFAIENSYGSADNLKYFVKAAHERGMAVHLDIVHNHYDAVNSDCDLWEFDGWWGSDNYGGIYFYQEDDKCCTIWGRRPDYSRAGVQDFIMDNVRMWLDEYHLDGFRWDSPMNIKFYGDYEFNADGYNLVRDINSMIHTGYPGCLSIGEDQNMDMFFDSEWYDSFHYDVVDQLTKATDAERNMWTIGGQLAYGSGLYRTIYTETHDKVGKLNNAQRLVTKLDSASPGSYQARKKATLGAALTFFAPGIPILFMGQEWFEQEAFDDYDPLDWAHSEENMRAVMMFKHLIRMRRDLDSTTKGLKGTGVDVYHVNDAAKILAFHRWHSHGTNDDVVIAVNFANTLWDSYEIEFPYAGTWYEQFNSDWTLYGDDYGNVCVTQVVVGVAGGKAAIRLAPYSVAVFSRSPSPARDADNDAMLDSWELDNGLNPADPSDGASDPDDDELTCVQEFELGTDPQVYNALSDWQTMHLGSSLNDWSLTARPMILTTHYRWEWVQRISEPSVQLKFVADGTWDSCWGDADQSGTVLPISGVGDPGGGETAIHFTGNLSTGTLHFVWVETNLSYGVTPLADVDADSDGMNDGWEVFFGFSTNSAADALEDPDDDDFTNLQEFENGTDPWVETPRLHDYDDISLSGTLNNWSSTRAPMYLYENYGWEAILHLANVDDVLFKFLGNGSWDYNWGDDSQGDTSLPITEYGDWQGGDIAVDGTLSGVYRFAFNQKSMEYTVALLPERDFDQDGMHDDWEELHGLNTNDLSDAAQDPDHDGLENLMEFEYGSDPHYADPRRAIYSRMAVAGSFNGWSATGTWMTLTEHFHWEALVTISNIGEMTFKFVADGTWQNNWGDNGLIGSAPPLLGVGDVAGSNITSILVVPGDYRFSFNDRTFQYGSWWITISGK